MILYHPIDDVYHCFCRILLLISRLPQEEHDLIKLQILDFYFLFPGLIKKIKWPKELSIYRQYFMEISNPYSDITNYKSIIIHLEHQVNDVIRYMAAYDLIDAEKSKRKLILKKNSDKYKPILEQISDYDTDLLDFIVKVLASIPLNGKDGLKSRTGLFEYRYDDV
jgi:hypothetical protein